MLALLPLRAPVQVRVVTELPLSGTGVAALTNECGSTSFQPTVALGEAAPGTSVACRVQLGSPEVGTVSTPRGGYRYLNPFSTHQGVLVCSLSLRDLA